MKNTACVNFVEIYVQSHDISRDYAQQLRARWKSFTAYTGKTCDDATEDDVSRWLADLQACGKLSQYTLAGYRANVLSVLQYAADLGMRPYLNLRRVRKIKRPELAPRGWSVDDVRRLVDACDTLQGHVAKIPFSVYFELLIRLGWDTGLRLGDLLRLRQQDVDTTPRVVVQSKTGKRVYIVCHASTVALCRDIGGSPDSLVLPWDRSRSELHRRIRQVVMRAGLTGTLKYLRRSSASLVEATGGSGRVFLGHSSVGVYEQHYRVAELAGVEAWLPPEL